MPTFLGTLADELGGGTEGGEGGVDLLLTSGGVSAGAYEVVKEALAPRGVEFLKVAMQPGMPQGAGSYGGATVVCLPGNPVSSLVSFEVFVRPALRAALGHPRPHRPVRRVPIVEDLTSPRREAPAPTGRPRPRRGHRGALRSRGLRLPGLAGEGRLPGRRPGRGHRPERRRPRRRVGPHNLTTPTQRPPTHPACTRCPLPLGLGPWSDAFR
ncbi:molybdopterin-binding protein [Nocardioides sp. TF02-7]|uniref:molybdopterin-binding protein n=1 Tax=Nocardioides sp. TF02-7 TaxID=2917724 RepID=UPI0023DC47D7|nr:molybdopterin-binding protein [Nocardioides sp. TF02-7]